MTRPSRAHSQEPGTFIRQTDDPYAGTVLYEAFRDRQPLGPWAQHAACRGLNPDMFFLPRGQDTRPAIRVCNSCPVTAECLQHAIDNNEKTGVWGGMAARERRPLHVAANRAAGRNNAIRYHRLEPAS